MNEAVLLKLKVIVERAVRPVRASLPQKKKMREELLAHVTGVLQDELRQGGDEEEALIQAERRFGDPVKLARKLQESVPKWDHIIFLSERLIQSRAGESLVRRAIRYGIMIFAFHASLTITLSLLILPLIGKAHELGFAVYILMLISASMGVMMVIVTPLTNGLERTLFGASGRSLFRASLLGGTSCFVPVLVQLVLIVGMSPFVSDKLTLRISTLWGTLPATILIPWILIVVAKQISVEKQYREEWAKLQVD